MNRLLSGGNVHFDKAGIENTDRALEVAFASARDYGIGHMVIASTTGYTARRVLEAHAGSSLNIVVVTHNTGFKEPGLQEFPEEVRLRLTGQGIKVLTGTMVLRSLGTAIRELTGYSEQDLIANTLRILCHGVKVCVEIAAMAADAGLIPPTDVITVAGSARGADTVCLIKAQPSNKFFETRVREIIIKPKEF